MIVIILFIFGVCVRAFSMPFRLSLLMLLVWGFFATLERDGIATAQSISPEFTKCPTQGCPEYPETQFSNQSHIQALITLSSSSTSSSSSSSYSFFDETRDDFDIFLKLISDAGLDGPLSAADRSGNATTIFVPRDAAIQQSAQDIRQLFGVEPTTAVAECKAPGAPSAEVVLSEAQAYEVVVGFARRFDNPSLALGVLVRNHVVPALVTLDDILDTESWRSWADQVITRQGDALDTENYDDGFIKPRLIPCQSLLFDTRQGRLIQVDRMLIPDFSSFSLAPPSPPPSSASTLASPTPSLSMSSPSNVSTSGALPASTQTALPSVASSLSPLAIESNSPAASQSSIPDISQAVVRVSPSSTLNGSVSSSEDQSTSNNGGVCFPGTATVTVILPSSESSVLLHSNTSSTHLNYIRLTSSENAPEPPPDTITTAKGRTRVGKLAMRDLRVGDHVMTSANANHDDTCKMASSPVILFSHWDADAQFDFVTLHTSAHRISLSASHLLYVNGDRRLKPAAAVTLDDSLQTLEGLQRVVLIETARLCGLYAPHTMTGNMFVDGVLVSCYTTAVPPTTAHSLLTPLRGVAAVTVARFSTNWRCVQLFKRFTGGLTGVFRRGASPLVSRLMFWILPDPTFQ